MRLLCDQMLERLARWLRAAGYDTTLAGRRTADAELLRQARIEGRWLLTRDRKLLEHRAAERHTLLLAAERPPEQAHELIRRLGVDWLHAPFSRCLLCNEPLQPSRSPAPKGVTGPVQCCPLCERQYWHGGHVERMYAQLRRWAGEAPSSK